MLSGGGRVDPFINAPVTSTGVGYLQTGVLKCIIMACRENAELLMKYCFVASCEESESHQLDRLACSLPPTSSAQLERTWTTKVACGGSMPDGATDVQEIVVIVLLNASILVLLGFLYLLYVLSKEISRQSRTSEPSQRDV